MNNTFAVGSYTRSGGRGISIYQWDDSSKSCRMISEYQDIQNPSYLSWDPSSRKLYAVSEVDDDSGAVTAFHLEEAGSLRYSGQQTGPGRAACHLSYLHNPDRLFAVSYLDGRLQTYSLYNSDKSEIGPVLHSYSYQGHGPVTDRQLSSHAHQVLSDLQGDFLYVVDLGSDTIWMHSPDALETPPSAALKVPPGYGPRHLAFDSGGSHVYILCELVPILLVCTIDPRSGELSIVQELETSTPENETITAPAAVKLHPSGRTLAVSNRFDDTIAVLAINRSSSGSRASVELSLSDRFPCGGETPRDISFSLDGSRLFIANQDSHNISCRNFDSVSGLPREGWGEEINTGSPVCLVML